jgi:hypothetical protein
MEEDLAAIRAVRHIGRIQPDRRPLSDAHGGHGLSSTPLLKAWFMFDIGRHRPESTSMQFVGFDEPPGIRMMHRMMPFNGIFRDSSDIFANASHGRPVGLGASSLLTNVTERHRPRHSAQGIRDVSVQASPASVARIANDLAEHLAIVGRRSISLGSNVAPISSTAAPSEYPFDQKFALVTHDSA